MPNKPSKEEALNAVRNRSFLNKDFSDFRAQLLDYAQTYFPDRIQDFSEASLGGLFLDLAAYVGDVSSFYLDHQFRELDPDTAVERDSIERMARNAGIKVTGASPAATSVTFTVKVNSQQAGVKFQPSEFDLPIIKKSTTLASDGGVTFELTEDLDFSERDENNELIADAIVNILEHPEESAAMAARARLAIETEYTWDREQQRLFDLYDRLLS